MRSSNVPLHASATLDVPEQIVRKRCNKLISLSHRLTVVINRKYWWWFCHLSVINTLWLCYFKPRNKLNKMSKNRWEIWSERQNQLNFLSYDSQESASAAGERPHSVLVSRVDGWSFMGFSVLSQLNILHNTKYLLFSKDDYQTFEPDIKINTEIKLRLYFLVHLGEHR